MPRRITVTLDDDVYRRLVEESVKRYGTVRALSKVVNELLRERFPQERISSGSYTLIRSHGFQQRIS